MKLKVVKVQILDLRNPVKLSFKWICENCGTENEDTVSEMVMLQYKVQKLGTKSKSVSCSKCKSPHEVRMVME